MHSDPNSPSLSFALDYLSGRGLMSAPSTRNRLQETGPTACSTALFTPGGRPILVVNEHRQRMRGVVNENDSFAYICNHLRNRGFAAPAIHAFDRERGWFILEDLGDVHLQDRALMLKDNPPELEALYRGYLPCCRRYRLKPPKVLTALRFTADPTIKHLSAAGIGLFPQLLCERLLQMRLSEDRMAGERTTWLKRYHHRGCFFSLPRLSV